MTSKFGIKFFITRMSKKIIALISKSNVAKNCQLYLSETHLNYIKALLPLWTYFMSKFLPGFDLRGTSLKIKSTRIGPQDSAT